MEIFDYVWPEARAPQIIVLFLVGLFLLWVALLVRSWIRLNAWRADVERIPSAVYLQQAVRADQEEEPGISQFERACARWGLGTESPVYSHLEALYRAGLEESRLDVSELITHTASTTLRDFSLLRVILGSFIVVGLLGTLIGLAESLATMGPALRAGLGAEAVTGGLSELLGGLRSAFGPSIVGVGLTVLGVIAFALYVWTPVTLFRTLLERKTLTVWVPALYPTTTQRMTAALEKSESQMQNNFKAAERVATFAEHLEGQFDLFRTELDGAAGSLGALRETTSQTERVAAELGKAAVHFSAAAEGVTRYQTDVIDQFGKLEARSSRFEKSVSGVLGGVSEGQAELRRFLGEDLRPLLAEQGGQMGAVLKTIRSYEQAYIKEREDVGDSLRDLLSGVKGAYEAIGKSNDDLVERIGAPLQGAVVDGLDSVQERLKGGLVEVQEGLQGGLVSVQDRLEESLGGIAQGLGRLETPLVEAASKMEGTLQTLDTRMVALLRDLQGEFHRQNEEAQKQAAATLALETQLAGLLGGLKESGDRQGGAVEALATRVDGLSGGMNALADALVGHARAVKAQGVDGGPAPRRRWWQRLLFWRRDRSAA